MNSSRKSSVATIEFDWLPIRVRGFVPPTLSNPPNRKRQKTAQPSPCVLAGSAVGYPAGIGRTGITSTDSPGKIVKCGWFSKSLAAASCESARTTM